MLLPRKCMDECNCHSHEHNRRDFFKKVLAASISAVVGLIPLGAGLAVWLDPLRRKSSSAGAVRVAALDALPADGVPRKFTVLADHMDAWNKSPATPVGAVYLRRTEDGKVEALNVVCPHAGCFVDFLPAGNGFHCPCHNSSFQLDGRIANRSSPAPRGMDTLEVEVRNEKEIWVKFRNFEAGRPQKIPLA